MNSIWNKNIALFSQRFPVLAKNYQLEQTDDIPADFMAPIEILNSRQNVPTAKENGKMLHSLYNPLREAEQAADALKKNGKETCVFFSFGLGYTANAYARKFPDDTLILIESDARYFFTALSLVDWTDVLSHKNLVIALQTEIEPLIQLIEQKGGIEKCAVSENTSQSAHASDYFSALKELLERNKRKNQINNSTLEKFSSLWLKNSCRNLRNFALLDGVNIYKDKLPPDIPAVILAAGPTLQDVLPYLSDIKERSLLIAVDTALRACLKQKVEPDFVILTDPQYYAYRHIAGLKSPSSILITESAAYPAVYRFECRKTVLCSSLFPLGKYIESLTGEKGELKAGGSVSTTAWEFARLAGAREIYFAGLDLGYPKLNTHIRGSTFEEQSHISSSRLNPAEKSGCASLFGANMEECESYDGSKILTDDKMKMFAWWFESRQEEFKQKITTYSLSAKSLKIPGFKVGELKSLLQKRKVTGEKKIFFTESEEKTQGRNQISLDDILSELENGFERMYQTARKGIDIAQKAITDRTKNPQTFINELNKIDEKILHSDFKDIAALVFPTERQLNKIFEDTVFSQDSFTAIFQRSKIIYMQLMNSIRNYQKKLFPR